MKNRSYTGMSHRAEPSGKDGWFSVLPPTPGLGQLGEGGN